MVAPSLGALSDSISIEVAPGRRNVQPHLSLNYSSMGGLGIAGAGWDLTIGKVERWRGDGTPGVGAADAFSFVLAGLGGELRNTGGGIYRQRLESMRREFRRSGDRWEMRDGEGSLHLFGSRPDSRIDDQIWMLDKVVDLPGNSITFYWQKLEGVLYPSEIRYTGFEPGDPGTNRVEFAYESRPDVRIGYSGLQYGETTKRLARISVYSNSNLVRSYLFSYNTDPTNGQSLLSLVTLVGADGRSTIDLRKLSYSARSRNWPTSISPAAFPLDWPTAKGEIPVRES